MPDFEDKIPLSEFSVTNILHATDRVPLIQASGEDWDNFCAALLDMALWIVKDAEYTSAGLNTQSKKIIGAINEVAAQSGSVDITSEIDTPAPFMSFNNGGNNTPFKSLIARLIAEQSGSGTPAPDNIRPIIGKTSIKVERTGKNLFDGVTYLEAFLTGPSVTTINTLAGGATVYTRCKPNTTYTISKKAGTRFAIGWTESIPQIGDDYYGRTADNTATNLTLTTGATAKYIVAFVFNPNSDTGTRAEMLATVQIEEGEPKTTFEKYNGQSKTYNFGQTVYGAEIECVSGVKSIIYGIIDLGDLSYTYESLSSSPSRMKATITGLKSLGVRSTPMLCSCFEVIDDGRAAADAPYNAIFTGAVDSEIIYITTTETDPATFQTAVTGQKLVYLLDSPTVSSVDPANFYTVDGINHVFVDDGTIKELEYYNENSNDIASLIELESGKQIDLFGTLETGETTLTISSPFISASSTIDVYVDTFGVNPSDVVVTDGQVVLTFASQASDLGVKVRAS